MVVKVNRNAQFGASMDYGVASPGNESGVDTNAVTAVVTASGAITAGMLLEPDYTQVVSSGLPGSARFGVFQEATTAATHGLKAVALAAAADGEEVAIALQGAVLADVTAVATITSGTALTDDGAGGFTNLGAGDQLYAYSLGDLTGPGSGQIVVLTFGNPLGYI